MAFVSQRLLPARTCHSETRLKSRKAAAKSSAREHTKAAAKKLPAHYAVSTARTDTGSGRSELAYEELRKQKLASF
jgi:hypothetical protein